MHMSFLALLWSITMVLRDSKMHHGERERLHVSLITVLACRGGHGATRRLHSCCFSITVAALEMMIHSSLSITVLPQWRCTRNTMVEGGGKIAHCVHGAQNQCCNIVHLPCTPQKVIFWWVFYFEFNL
jgi:hypothetical protein